MGHEDTARARMAVQGQICKCVVPPCLALDQHLASRQAGGVAQMVERSLSMREVPGSIPGASRNFFL